MKFLFYFATIFKIKVKIKNSKRKLNLIFKYFKTKNGKSLQAGTYFGHVCFHQSVWKKKQKKKRKP